MFKYMMTEVVSYGHEEEEKAYRKKAALIWKKYGFEERVWQVQGRTSGQVFVEFSEVASREEADAVAAKVFADEGWIQLQADRVKAGTIVPGSMEVWMLSSE